MADLGSCNICGKIAGVIYPLLYGSPAFCGKHYNERDAGPFGTDFGGPDDFDIPVEEAFLEETPWELSSQFWKKRPTASSFREVLRWTTKDGRTYLLKDLSDQHLANIIPYIERVKMVGVSKDKVKCLREVQTIMKSEQKYRKKRHLYVAPYGPKITFKSS